MIKNLDKYDKKFLLDSLKEMIIIRRFEESAITSYGLRKIGGFFHAYNGQEALSTGSIKALDLKKDYVVAGYRDHGYAINCGIDPKAVMSELYGKSTGCSGGRGGSMHMFSEKLHMLGGNGIVGGQIGTATGSAFAQRYWKDMGMKKDDLGVSLCYFGDGAIHQGIFHECLNMASLWKLPAIYIVENNHYAMGTSIERSSSVGSEFEKKAAGYGMEGIVVQAMDFLNVYEEFGKIVEKVRKTGEPVLVNAITYRYKGHSVSDPQKYRKREEIEEYQKKDPIITLKDQLIEGKIISQSDYEKMDGEVKAYIKECVAFAESAPEPSPETLFLHILAD